MVENNWLKLSRHKAKKLYNVGIFAGIKVDMLLIKLVCSLLLKNNGYIQSNGSTCAEGDLVMVQNVYSILLTVVKRATKPWRQLELCFALKVGVTEMCTNLVKQWSQSWSKLPMPSHTPISFVSGSTTARVRGPVSGLWRVHKSSPVSIQ